MPRSLSRFVLRRWPVSLCRPVALSCGRRGVTLELYWPRSITTLEGYDFFVYGGGSFIKSLQMRIVSALQLGDRNKALGLLFELGRGNHLPKADDLVHILECCAKFSDPLFVMETWKFMEEKEIDASKECYLLSINALCKGGYLKEAINLMSLIGENHDVYSILPMYNNFLRACAHVKSVHYANQCLDLMEHRKIGKNEVTYMELLKLAVGWQNLSIVREIWREYTRFYNFSIISLQKFIWSFTRLGDLESAYHNMQHMLALVIRGSIFANSTAERKLCPTRLDIPIPSLGNLSLKKCSKGENEMHMSVLLSEDNTKTENDSEQSTPSCMGIREVVDSASNLFRECKSEPVMKILMRSFNDLVHACAQTRNHCMAEQLIVQMQNLGLEPSCLTYDGYIRAAIYERGFSHGIEVLKVMHMKNLKPYNSTLATIATGCSRDLELDLAECLLNQISESQHIHPFNAFLRACDAQDQPERAIRMLAKMKQLNLKLDIKTYELLFSLFGNVNFPYEDGNMLSHADVAKRINAIESDMVKNGIQHSQESMKNLLKALGGEGMVRDLIWYLRVAENQACFGRSYLGTSIYNTVLHSLVEAKESHNAIEIFKKMRSCGFQPDSATYNIMIDCCSIIKCYKSASALVAMMVCDGYPLHIPTHTALLKTLLEDGDFEEALQLVEAISGVCSDVVLYNTILKKACEKGRIDVMELIVETMHQEKIRPDSSTCLYVLSTYLNRGFTHTGVEALQVLSVRMLSGEADLLREKRRELEDDIVMAEEDDSEAEARILQFFANSDETVAVALLNLRLCAILGCAISWSPDQSPWATRLSSSYGSRKKDALL